MCRCCTQIRSNLVARNQTWLAMTVTMTVGLPSTDVDPRPYVTSSLSQVARDSEMIKKHHHEGKNVDVIDLLARKRAELVHEAARDQKAYKKKHSLS